MAEPERGPERPVRFETLSGLPIEPLYTPDSLRGWSADEKLGRPGEYPFTRGVYPTMYRGRLWTMRMFAGFGAAEDTNARFRSLLAAGQTGLSIAYDMPTLYGYDTDHPEAEGEFCCIAAPSRPPPVPCAFANPVPATNDSAATEIRKRLVIEYLLTCLRCPCRQRKTI